MPFAPLKPHRITAARTYSHKVSARQPEMPMQIRQFFQRRVEMCLAFRFGWLEWHTWHASRSSSFRLMAKSMMNQSCAHRAPCTFDEIGIDCPPESILCSLLNSDDFINLFCEKKGKSRNRRLQLNFVRVKRWSLWKAMPQAHLSPHVCTSYHVKSDRIAPSPRDAFT